MKALLNIILWIRQFIYYVYHYLLTGIFSLIYMLLFLIKAPYGVRTRMAQLNSFLSRVGMFFLLWIRCEIKGKENISKVPCIYVSKHQAEWETIVFPSVITHACYVAKQELLDIPILGSGLKGLEYIGVDRSAGIKAFKKVIAEGKNRLSRGISVVIFPEGTRVEPHQNPKFHKSAMSLAKATDVPVIPIAHNAGSYWPAHRFPNPIRPGKITVHIGQAIDGAKDIDTIVEESYQWIANEMTILEK